MRKIVSIVSLPGLELLLFLLFFALFGWPIITIVERTHNCSIFIYIFLVWSIIILLLAFIARHLNNGSKKGNEPGGMTDV